MKMSRRATVQIASLAVAALVVAAPAAAQTPAHILVPADKVQWGPAPPTLPPGAQAAVLEGNPAEKGAVTLRLKFPANYTVPPHWHSKTERVTVLSGALNVGMGDTVVHRDSYNLEPGGFVSLPAQMHHYAWTATPTVVQISLEGPFDVFYVNPADDPQNKLQTRR